MQQMAKTAAPTLTERYTTLLHASLFVLGFSLIFVIGWGGAATLLGQLFGELKTVIARVGGVFIIGFGLFNLGILKVRWLNYDTRPQWQTNSNNRMASSLLMGVVFAAGWTPCIGTTLGAILTLGFAQETSGQAMLLSSGYALGLGAPFLLIGLGMNRAVQAVRKLRPYLRHIQIASGIFLIAIGLLLVTNRMTTIAIWAQQNGFYLDLPLGGTAPTYLIAILAGLLSFLSPCVLPLVPAYIGYLSGQAFGQTAK
ncbi:MAG: cytochrome c biogenesis protein CcdA [Anaerolineaceae bacterium]|nr:cytochrome c biogenesis protein CcdA [Anaerolineaceae bacterium]